MSAWDWFKINGDKVFTFIALSTAALQGQSTLPHWLLQGTLICSILATAAHQSFFPNSQVLGSEPTLPSLPAPPAPTQQGT